jgi:DNA-binding MarR family transcriptional regulator
MDINITRTDENLQFLIDRFWETVPPVWGRIRQNIRSIATQNFDITVEQFHILRHIRRGTESSSELADAQQISRSAVSQAVDILVERGLVSRQQSAEDRRFVKLELTSSGNELLDTIFQENCLWMKEKLAALTPEEIESVIHALEILNKSFYRVIV